MNAREELHRVIDSIEDEKTVEGYLELIKSIIREQRGGLISSLSAAQRSELYASWAESETDMVERTTAMVMARFESLR